VSDPKDSSLGPEVEAFVNWFADWWLRRGRRLVAAAKEADPDRFNKRKKSKRAENRLPLRWDQETGRIVLDKDRETDGAVDSPRPRSHSDKPTK
jgi:hypothetical protein